MQTIEAKFMNDTGFNYTAFLKELQPQEPIKPMYKERLEQIRLTNQKARMPEQEPMGNLDLILQKLKTIVSDHISLKQRKYKLAPQYS